MKNITIDGIEYTPVVKEDQYAEIRKHVGRWGNVLAIIGKKKLGSYICGAIDYSNNFKNKYTDELHFEHTTLGELKKGDVFFLEGMDQDDLYYYQIFMGMSKENRYRTQFLCLCDGIYGIEVIKDDWHSKENTKVIKILRY